ncbi:MAG: S24/S26 family peptidase [Eubacteriales bacterium]|nr:S24/S26 family peptidase [Eubacteriales bacterium]
MSRLYTLTELYPLIDRQLKSGGSMSFTVKGTSMKPTLTGGVDTVKIIKPAHRMQKYDIAFYRRDDCRFVLHRIIKVTRNGYICRGDNQTLKERCVTDDNVIGLVSEYTHKSRRIKTDSARHRLYAAICVKTAIPRCFFYSICQKIRSLYK